jgi:hypothetical protein
MTSENYYELPFWINGNLTDEQQEIYDRLQFVSMVELFAEFDKSCKDESVVDSDLYEVTRGIIGDRLGLVSREIIGQVIGDEIAELSNRINVIDEKYENHRHDFSKMYCERPDN